MYYISKVLGTDNKVLFLSEDEDSYIVDDKGEVYELVEVSKDGVDISKNAFEGMIYESIIYTEFDGRKYRDKLGREIDLVIGEDYYEIKHSSVDSDYQCRWLLCEEITSGGNLNVIYSGVTKDKYISEQDTYVDAAEKAKSEEVRRRLLEYSASTEKRLVHYINIEEFLLKGGN